MMYKNHHDKIGRVMSYVHNFGDRFSYGVPTTCCYVHVQSDNAKNEHTKIVQFWMYHTLGILRLIGNGDCHHFQAFAFDHATTACALVKPMVGSDNDFMVSYQCDGHNYMYAW